MVHNLKRFLFTYLPLVLPYILVVFLFKEGHFFWGIFLFVVIESMDRILDENRIRKEYIRELDWLCRAVINDEELQEYRLNTRLYFVCRQLLREGKIKIGMSHNEVYWLVDALIEKKEDVLKKFAFDCLGAAIKDKKYTISIWGYGFNFPTPKLIFEFEDNVLTKQHVIESSVSSFFFE